MGLPDDFQCEYHKTLRELNKMDTINSPLDGLYTFEDALVSDGGIGQPVYVLFCSSAVNLEQHNGGC